MNLDSKRETGCPRDESPPGGACRDGPRCSISRRAIVLGGATSAALAAGAALLGRRRFEPAPVFIARNQRYDASLERTIRDGLLAAGFGPDQVRGKSVLLKPNMVEPNREAPQMTTHPGVVLAAADVFRKWGGRVCVGEGPGHLRDTEYALYESGIGDALDSARLEFRDLNYEETVWTPNRGRASSLDGFHFPRSVVEADLIVSLPKMKTHHWIGMTAAMKNLYGVIPGIRYGWPKNVLHWNGIPETVFDINASLAKTITIVDGIVCMEGDGPVMGTPKEMGLILVGTCLPSVDATVARLMGLEPKRIEYLRLAGRYLGPITEDEVIQRGERWEPLAEPFEVVDAPHLTRLTRKMPV